MRKNSLDVDLRIFHTINNIKYASLGQVLSGVRNERASSGHRQSVAETGLELEQGPKRHQLWPFGQLQTVNQSFSQSFSQSVNQSVLQEVF